MSTKISTFSPSKKNSKKQNELMGQQMVNQKRKQFISNKNSSFIPSGQKINFQSQDSEGSDISYQSSIESQQDINIGQIDYFKQQMGRFFINYPELINNQIIDDDKWYSTNNFQQEQVKGFSNQKEKSENKLPPNQKGIQQRQSVNNNFWLDSNMMTGNSNKEPKKEVLNKNWTVIADQILNQAKDSCSFFESLSRRIALYRSKVQQEDLIDILLKEQKNIMKQIDIQINQKKKQNKGTKNTMEHIQGCQNMFFSWRKKKQMENRLNLQRDDQQIKQKKTKAFQEQQIINQIHRNHRIQSAVKNRKILISKDKNSSKISIPKANSTSKNDLNSKLDNFFITSENFSTNNLLKQNPQKLSRSFHNKSKGQNKFNESNKNLSSFSRAHSNAKNLKSQKRSQSQGIQNNINEQDRQNRTNQPSSSSQTFWKHLINFQPRTQAGRQLCELIRKTNSPTDELGIKKTIMTFLSRSKQMVQNQIILKSTISQKIQKLYNDDSKQLLMFYPTKMSTALNINQGNALSNKGQAQSKQTSLSNPLSNMLIGSNYNDLRSQQFTGTDSVRQLNSQTSNLVNYASLLPNNDNDSSNKLFQEGQKFINLLEDIVEGPLMKYWMMIQENKM